MNVINEIDFETPAEKARLLNLINKSSAYFDNKNSIFYQNGIYEKGDIEFLTQKFEDHFKKKLDKITVVDSKNKNRQNKEMKGTFKNLNSNELDEIDYEMDGLSRNFSLKYREEDNAIGEKILLMELSIAAKKMEEEERMLAQKILEIYSNPQETINDNSYNPNVKKIQSSNAKKLSVNFSHNTGFKYKPENEPESVKKLKQAIEAFDLKNPYLERELKKMRENAHAVVYNNTHSLEERYDIRKRMRLKR